MTLSDKDRRLYTAAKTYWQTGDDRILTLTRQLKTPRAIYDYVVHALTYDIDRVLQRKERAGALGALKNPSSAVCLEFTDLFIALARAAGIPAREVDGFAYTLDAITGALQKLIGGVKGLTTRPSADMTSVLYSRGLQNRVDAFLLNVKTGATENFPVATLSEKCAWGKKAPKVVYCGVPESLPQGAFPDDWYQGRVSFSDALWRIDTETNTPERLSFPEIDIKESIDAIEPFLSTDDGFLFFINKKDSSLWSLRITH